MNYWLKTENGLAAAGFEEAPEEVKKRIEEARKAFTIHKDMCN